MKKNINKKRRDVEDILTIIITKGVYEFVFIRRYMHSENRVENLSIFARFMNGI